MNRPIRRIAIVAMVMFAMLLANGSWIVVVRQGSLNERPENRRVRDSEFSQDRGPIMAGQTQIASTVPSKDRFAYQRTYPQAAMYAPITGYYSYDHARIGLEQSYNTQLAGTDDSQFIRRVVDTATGEKPTGASVETTIIPKAQEAAFKGLGNRKGAVVAMDPRTGAVLAMASTPSYDPNRIASHDTADANQAWSDLADDKDRPMANRAAREVYPPGSTFKLVTAAAALESGMNPDTMVDSPSELILPGTNYGLTNDTNCGADQITLDHALAVSCNTAFANVGIKLGDDALRTQAEKFGFGRRHLNELNGVDSRFPADPNPSQTALSAIGQYDVAASPLQMASVTAAIANDGAVYEPYLVSTVRSANLSVIQKNRPSKTGIAVSPDNAEKLQSMMTGVVESGTGTNARIKGHEVGGKTGTAQTSPENPPYAWFTSYAMDSSGKVPEVAVAVFIEDAGGQVARSEIGGNALAAPVARQVMQAVL